MAKIRAESLLRRPLRGISTCLTAATVRSTSTTELPTRKIASPQSYTEAKLHGIDPQPVCKRPVPEAAADSARNAAGYSVLEDRLVRLGDDRTDREGGDPGRWYRVLTVEVSTEEEITEEEIQILTNLLWIDAEQICRLYRHRWSIEIVFRWIKDRMQLDRFISRDPTGVVRQTLAALIVWGLLAIFNEGGEQFSPKKLWRKLQAAMHQALFDLGRRYQQNLDPPA